ncbi:ATP-binding protein [Actinokineospora terrae]|uniref:GTPase SAR1 family protein n=1 Tax=Actinokineospora terrae TaxID=155974 RepID=A0A1H9WHD9_9PSEU|nr:ATP-binding protein [Actinokineospora terrae]SES33097.1 GTPase SAR1 family protein [Actinokineospora terrae]
MTHARWTNPFTAAALPLVERPELLAVVAEIDHFAAGFTRFTGAFTQAPPRLVLVTGPSGCGKSTLAQRCARWLLDTGDPVVCVDLSREPLALTVRERIDSVCRGLAARFGVPCDDPRRVFDEVDAVLPADALLVVLLPPVELPAELRWYAGAARDRMILFTESSHLHEAPDDAVVLPLGPLVAGDIARFVTSRLAAAAPPIPPLSPAAIDWIEQRWSPIGLSADSLRRLLHEAYEDAHHRGTPEVDLDAIMTSRLRRLLDRP